VSVTTLSPSDARPRPGVPLLVLAGVAWGTGGLLGRLLSRQTGLSALAVAAYRLGLGGLLVLAAVGVLALAGRLERRSVHLVIAERPCAASPRSPRRPPPSRPATSPPSR
jgi:drug/metabolite transporter (DMT)-like permease